ncbi:MAG: DUF5719 family protein [Acidimicrobiales bacterium]
MTRRSPPTDGRRRLTAVLVIIALLVGAAAVDQVQGPAQAATAPVVNRSGSPTAVAPVSALSSSWYCQVATAASPPAGGNGSTSTTGVPKPAQAPTKSKSQSQSKSKAPGRARASILLANTGAAPVHGTVSTGSGRSRRSMAVTVPAMGHVLVDESKLSAAPDVAATVALDGGGVAVQQRLTGPGGTSTSTSNCASAPSAHWYFASGSTAGGDQLLVSLYNPLPTSAIADLSFATDKGRFVPSDDQGIVVPGGQQVVLDVGLHVQQRPIVATHVHVRLGRLVASETEIGKAAPGPGTWMALGAPATARTWHFPAGLVAKGAGEHLDLFNPSSSPAKVKVALGLASGSAEPIQLSVPPRSVVDLAAASQHRIPPGTLFALVVSSVNDVGIVAQRSITDTAPRGQRGRASMIGGQPARQWALAGGAASPNGWELVVADNPGPRPATVSVVLLDGDGAAAPGLGAVVVPPGRPVLLPLSKHLTAAQRQLPMVVSSTRPVLVEQDLSPAGGKGLSTVLGEPLP